MHAAERPERPSDLNPAVPPDLEAVVLRCLDKDPGKRFQTADEVREALSICRDHGTWTEEDARDWWGAQETLGSLAEAMEQSSLDIAVGTTIHLKASDYVHPRKSNNHPTSA